MGIPLFDHRLRCIIEAKPERILFWYHGSRKRRKEILTGTKQRRTMMRPYSDAGFDIDANVASLTPGCFLLCVGEGFEVRFESAVNQVCRIGAIINI